MLFIVVFVLFGYMQNTVFGGKTQKPDYRDIPYAVFRYSFVYVIKLRICYYYEYVDL
jgi:hypothetical protein